MATNLIRNLPPGFEWRIEWKPDEGYQDFTHLGEFSGREPSSDFAVDRKNGHLLCPGESLYQQFVFVGDCPDKFDWQGRTWELYDEDEGLYVFDGCQILREGLHTRRSRNEYEWWYPTQHSLKEVSAECPLEMVLDWVEQDYDRMCTYGDMWIYEYARISLWYGDDELGEATTYSVESDSEDSYKREVEEDLMWEMLDLEMLKAEELHANALVLGYRQLNVEGETLEIATNRLDAFQALIALYLQIEAERKAHYEAARAAYEAKKSDG